MIRGGHGVAALANRVLRPKSEGRGFRPDIQGLRAIAVMLVALAHAGVSWLQGGYVGVDVFFVISGFLITGFLLRRAEQSGRVPFFEFYAARARRILPAATLTIVVTVVASWHYLNYIRAVSVFHDAIWSAFFAANIHFSQVGTDYFAQSNPPSPLQHFWTLAVEEQFYIVWPALLAVLLILARKRRPLVIAATAGLCLASLVYCIAYTETSQVAAYFSTLARAWELGLGALIAMLAAELGRLPAGLRAYLTWAGVAGIIVAGVFYSSGTQFPGYAALLPVLGSACVIVGGIGGEPRYGVGAILRYQPFQFIGDTSYAFYLWHWPILVIAWQYLGHQLSVLQNLGLLAIAFVVSAFTYLTFENPIRHAKTLAMPRAALVLWPVTVGMVLILANVAIASEPKLAGSAHHYAPIVVRPIKSYPKLVAKSVTPARLAQPVPTNLTPSPADVFNDAPPFADCLHRAGAGGSCILGDPNAKRSFALIGDSHAGTWADALNYFAQQHHYRLIVLTHEGCTVGIATTGHDPVGHCDGHWWQSWLRKLSADEPDFAVVAQYFDPRVPPAQMYLGMRQELTQLDEAVPRTVVMEDPPRHLLIDPTDCLLRPGATLGDCTLVFPHDMGVQYATLRTIVESHSKDRFLRTQQWFCASGKCPVVIGNMIAFRDTNHMSDTYSRHLAPAVSHFLWELTRP
jgi:peptidoglycan/LPS O-acetylase OafA/YrhL